MNSLFSGTRPVIRANLIENMWSLIYTMAELNICFAQEERIADAKFFVEQTTGMDASSYKR